MTRTIVVLALAAGLMATGCGESAEEGAQKQVCDARADIKKQVDALKGLTVSTITLDGVKSNLDAIEKDLQQITNAQGDLEGGRKQQVQKANATFKSEVTNVASDLVKSLSLSDGKQQIQTALQGFEASYQSALAPIDCS